jgi:4-hydroxyphenylpyruvate dioxygenase
VHATVLGNGGEAIDHKPESGAIDVPKVKGIGDCMLYLVPSGEDVYATTTRRSRAPTRIRRASA